MINRIVRSVEQYPRLQKFIDVVCGMHLVPIAAHTQMMGPQLPWIIKSRGAYVL